MSAVTAASNLVTLLGKRHEGAPLLHQRWTRVTDQIIGAIVEPTAAALIVIEVAILGTGVCSRYVFHNAQTWTDELATILFLWLTMLGAVVAYRRGEHMRVSAFARRASPEVQSWLDTLSAAVVALFCLELFPASFRFFVQEQIDMTPTLAIPRSYVILAIIVGLVLLFVLAVLRLLDGDRRKAAVVVGSLVAVSALAFAGRGVFHELGNLNLIIFFVGVVAACIALGVPIAFSFGVATLSYIALTTQLPLNIVVGRIDEGVENLVLLAVPLFVLLGALIVEAGIASRLVGAIASLVGHLRGGLDIVLVAAMFLVSGISGSKAADMAAVAPVLFPEMEKRGQQRGSMIALLSASGAMSETIPPSLVLIILGTVVGLSIQQLFTAGLLPAVVASLALLVVALRRARHENGQLPSRSTLRQIGRALFVALPGLVLPLVIRWFVISGIATATEVSTVGIVYALIVGVFLYREFKWNRAFTMLNETASLTGAIMLIIGAATAMGWALTRSGFAQQLADALSRAPGGALGVMVFSIVLFLVLGQVLEGIPAMVLFGPLLFPIAKQVGINEIHYAIVAVLAMGIGLFTPPLGVGYYAACAIGKAEPTAAMQRIVPYLLSLLAALLVVAAFPWLSIGLLPHH
jgi:tripartite ATP-independent transporter DctM subunit